MRVTHAINSIYKLISFFELIHHIDDVVNICTLILLSESRNTGVLTN